MSTNTMFDYTPPPPNGVPPTPPRPRQHLTLKPHEHAHLAQWLEDYLVDQHLQASELAARMEISTNYLNAMKSTRNLREGMAPTYRFVTRMATRLGFHLYTLIGDPVPPAPPEPAPPASPATLEEVVAELRQIREHCMTMIEWVADLFYLCKAATEGHRDAPLVAPPVAPEREHDAR